MPRKVIDPTVTFPLPESVWEQLFGPRLYEAAGLTIEERRERNLRAPISRLHVEILANIFCYVRNIDTEHRTFDWTAKNTTHSIPYKWRWMSITRVCHEWRQLASNTAALWTHIIVSPCHYERGEEMLQRAKQCLLLVHASILPQFPWGTSSSSLPDRLVNKLRENLSRCHTLTLQEAPDLYLHRLLSTVEAPQLKYLSITGSIHPLHHDPPFVLSDDVLHAASLRCLHIELCGIDCRSSTNLLRGLTHLKLFYISESHKLSCREFTSLLADIPALEVLHLHHGIAENSDDMVRPTAQTNRSGLQHLKFLKLICGVHAMGQFLCDVEIPPLCKVELESWESTSFDITPIFSWISNRFRPPLSSVDDVAPLHDHWRSFLLCDVEVQFKIKAFCEVLSHRQIKGADAILTFTMSWNKSELDDYGTFFGAESIPLQPFLTSLPLSCIAYLEVACDESLGVSKSVWVKAFGSIRTLKAIHLTTYDYSSFFKAATYNSSHPQFPALSSLTLDSFSMKHLTDNIVLSLRSRMEGGLPLQQLVLMSYRTVSRAVVEDLRKVALQVKVRSNPNFSFMPEMESSDSGASEDDDVDEEEEGEDN